MGFAPLTPLPPRSGSGTPTDPIRPVGADYGLSPLPFPGTEHVNPAEVFAGPGYNSPRPLTSLLARVSIVAAVCGMIPGASLVACIAGHLALREINASPRSGRGLAQAGLTLGYIGVTLWLLLGIVLLVSS